MGLNRQLLETVSNLNPEEVGMARREVIEDLIGYLQAKISLSEEAKLNFICTHNSRRSQLAEIWAQTAAFYYGLPVACFSGGVEITAFNESAIHALKKAGFSISQNGENNPIYSILYSDEVAPVQLFSKKYDDEKNPKHDFAAIMTCSHADENCPFIPGAEKRIALHYEDPKKYDGTQFESEKYLERSLQIANEMFYAFSRVTIPT
jgi:arsenate reductase (thioredoxin)